MACADVRITWLNIKTVNVYACHLIRKINMDNALSQVLNVRRTKCSSQFNKARNCATVNQVTHVVWSPTSVSKSASPTSSTTMWHRLVSAERVSSVIRLVNFAIPAHRDWTESSMTRLNLASACLGSRSTERASAQAVLLRLTSTLRMTRANAFSTTIGSTITDLALSAEANGTVPAVRNYPTCRG